MRINTIDISIQYEGTPLTEKTLDEILLAIGDDIAISLRDRTDWGGSENTYVAGLKQTIGEDT
jgi:hypothetical protein